MANTACPHPYLEVNRIKNQTTIWSGLIILYMCCAWIGMIDYYNTACVSMGVAICMSV